MTTLYAVSDGFDHFDIPIKEYLKRLSKSIRFIPISPVKQGTPEIIRKKETEKILEKFKNTIDSYIILLDEQGVHCSTLDLQSHLLSMGSTHKNIIFIVWGAYGVERTLLFPRVQKILKISDFVVPHSLALLILLEQIYRCGEITKHSAYHHL